MQIFLRPRFFRWIDMGLAAVLAASVVFILLPSLHELSAHLILPWTHWGWVMMILVPVLTALAVPLVRTGCLRMTRSTVCYPSTMWAVILGSILVIISHVTTQPATMPHEISLIDIVLLAVAVTIAVVIATSYDRFNRWSQRHPVPKVGEHPAKLPPLLQSTPAETLEHLAANPAALSTWLKTDTAINSDHQDLLGVQPTVHRLVEALQASPDRTIGLLGRFGSGKTSLVCMAQHKMGISAPVRLVWVETWGVTPQAIPRVVLRSAIEEISQYADTIGLGGVPEEYLRAMQSASPGWARSLVASDPGTPFDQLQRLDRVLTAIDIHLSFVIEDVDRNAPQENLPQLYVGLQALLSQLRSCRKLGFILAAGNASLDFDRLCDVKVHVRDLQEEQSGPIIQAFRHQQLKAALAAGVIIPDRSKIDIEGLRRQLPRSIRRMFEPTPTKVDVSLSWEHLLPLMATPRRLKAALIHVELAWHKLQGEVDFDQLLVCEIVRVSCPAVMDAIADIRSRQSSIVVPSEKASKELREWAQARLDEALGRAAPEDREHLTVLAESLTPTDWASHTYWGRPCQNLLADEVYWQRIWSGWAGDPHAPSDQAVLRAMRTWKASPGESDLAEQLENSAAFTDVFERLVTRHRAMITELRLSTDDLMQLAASTLHLLLERRGAAATHEDSHTFVPIWRIVSNRGEIDQPKLLDWMQEQVGHLLPRNLRLALDVEHYWANTKFIHMNPKGGGKVRQFFLEESKRLWANDEPPTFPNLSSQTLSHVFSLCHLIYREHHDDETGPLTVADWRWLVPILEQAVSRDLGCLAPVAAALALGGRHSTSPPEDGERWDLSVELSNAKACRLIPDQAERLSFFTTVCEQLGRASSVDWDDLVQVWVEEATNVLQGWIAEGVPEPPKKPESGSEDADASDSSAR